MWAEVSGLMKRFEAESEGKAVLETAMKGRMDGFEADLLKATEDKEALRSEVEDLKARVGKCEATAGFDAGGPLQSRRRNQQQDSVVCGIDAVQSMLFVCCASGPPAGNGHRLQEVDGCDSLPPMCSLQCSAQFIAIFENCQDQPLMQGLSTASRDDWNSYYVACAEAEQSAAGMGVLQPVTVRMYRVMISSDAAQTQAEVFGGGGQGGESPPVIRPLPELPSPPPPPSSAGSSTDIEQYHAQCTTANVLTCVPTCNSTTHGYELLAMIDGTDTKFSCNLANRLFSWVGAASEGGYLGSDFITFISAVLSGAAGTYMLTLSANVLTQTSVRLVLGQRVVVIGRSHTWQYTGGDTAFVSSSGSSLRMEAVTLQCDNRPRVIDVGGGANLNLLSAGVIDNENDARLDFSCSVLASAMGVDGLTCQEDANAVTVGGPISISGSGIAFPEGSTRYLAAMWMHSFVQWKRTQAESSALVISD